MLVVSNQRFLPNTINTIVLQKDDLYFYVHRDVYDQAVILSDRFPTPELLAGEISLDMTEEQLEAIKWGWEQLPRPINILTPFVSLLEESTGEDTEMTCGALHIITSTINVRNFIKMPKELRKSVSFSLSIKEEYELSWERFFMEAVPYDQRHRSYDAPRSYERAEGGQEEEETVYLDEQGNFVFVEDENESMDDILAEMGLGPSAVTETEEESTPSESQVPAEEKEETRKLFFQR